MMLIRKEGTEIFSAAAAIRAAVSACAALSSRSASCSSSWSNDWRMTHHSWLIATILWMKASQG